MTSCFVELPRARRSSDSHLKSPSQSTTALQKPNNTSAFKIKPPSQRFPSPEPSECPKGESSALLPPLGQFPHLHFGGRSQLLPVSSWHVYQGAWKDLTRALQRSQSPISSRRRPRRSPSPSLGGFWARA